MASIWSIDGEGAAAGYRNIKTSEDAETQKLKAAIEGMWLKFEPFADPSFIKQFSQDPDAQFWEMYLGNRLLEAGKQLLTAKERKTNECLPDLGFIEDGKRIWIEAIAPGVGEEGPNQVVKPKFLNEGGGVEDVPLRQVQLRLTSALSDKGKVLNRYMLKGAMQAGDVKIVAIAASRFALQASDDPPTILSAVFPLGNEYITVDKGPGGFVKWGYHPSPAIEKIGAKKPVERTAFISDAFPQVSAIIWSRASIGNFSPSARPLTIVHNPNGATPMPQGWDLWDKEYVCEKAGEGWEGKNIKAAKVD